MKTEVASPTQRIRFVVEGACGRLRMPSNHTKLVRGDGRDVHYVHLNEHGAYCNTAVVGRHTFEKWVSQALHGGGEFVVGTRYDVFPSKWQDVLGDSEVSRRV